MPRYSFKILRESYVPKGAVKVADKASDAVAYVYTDKRARPCAMIFYGKQAKPVGHYSFRNDAERVAHVTRAFTSRRAHDEMITKHRAEDKKPHTLVVGQVLRAMWGYDQTNIDYYQVTRIVSPRTVEIRKIGAQREETAFMVGRCLPMEDHFTGEPMIKRANARNSVKITSYCSAHPWKGKIDNWTAYA